MTTVQAFLDDIMLDTIEDDIGLWEVAGLAQVAFPDKTRSEQLSAAKEVVRALLNRGWIEIRARDMTPGPGVSPQPGTPRPVEPDGTTVAFANDRNWLEDWIRDASVRYFIHATERGNSELHEDLRRRGMSRVTDENSQG